jgi:Na+/H+ antiporter NhaD/arsenite permease-like protein
VLDNAPTYLAICALAADAGSGLSELSLNRPEILQAISAGAVFMGANTYIGNGPNFMVKSMAENMGYKMPSFFGYMLYSVLILIPVFALATLIFFVKW